MNRRGFIVAAAPLVFAPGALLEALARPARRWPVNTLTIEVGEALPPQCWPIIADVFGSPTVVGVCCYEPPEKITIGVDLA